MACTRVRASFARGTSRLAFRAKMAHSNTALACTADSASVSLPGYDLYERTRNPTRRPDRPSSLHGSPAESAPWARRRDKVSRVPCAIVFRDTAKTASVKVVECEQTNPGSHAAHPETPGGAPHGHFRAPTATDGSDENPPGVGKLSTITVTEWH